MFMTFLAAALLIQSPSDNPEDWRTQIEIGKQAFAKHDYAAAAAKLGAAAELAGKTPDTQAELLETLRLLAAVYRETGDHAQAERVLRKGAGQCAAADPLGLPLAAVLEELATVERAQGHGEETLAAIDQAIAIRESHSDWPRIDLARDLTTAALLRYKPEEAAKSIEGLERAVKEWDLAAPGDPQALPAMEALAGAYRDNAKYQEAEALLVRALRIHEAASGPDGADIISAVDSLAYVEFGLKKFSEAETLYHRLLALWEKNAGADHPMAALTHDKMAEFYAFQHRYDEAEKEAAAALAARTKMHVASLNQTGRMLLMQAKIPEAEELYNRALKIGDLAHAPDDVLDPVLRTYAVILRSLDRKDEAAALDARVKDALIRKADQEGRRPSPVKQSQ